MYVSRASRGFNYSEPLKRADKHYIYIYIYNEEERREKEKEEKFSLSLEPTRMRALEERKASIRFNFHPGGHNRTIESYSLCKNWLCFLETIHSTPRHAEITTIIRQFGRPCVQKNSKVNKQGSNRSRIDGAENFFNKILTLLLSFSTGMIRIKKMNAY